MALDDEWITAPRRDDDEWVTAPKAEDDGEWVTAPSARSGAPDQANPGFTYNSATGQMERNSAPAVSAPPAPTTSDLSMATEYGPAVAVPATDTSNSLGERVYHAGEEVARAAKEGFGTGPLGASPPLETALRSSGIFGPEPGRGTPTQMLNEGVIAPAMAALDLAWRAGGAGFRAVQESIHQALTPIIGETGARDAAAHLEAFGGTPHMFPTRTVLHDIAEGRLEPPTAESPGRYARATEPHAASATPTLDAMAAEARAPADEWVTAPAAETPTNNAGFSRDIGTYTVERVGPSPGGDLPPHGLYLMPSGADHYPESGAGRQVYSATPVNPLWVMPRPGASKGGLNFSAGTEAARVFLGDAEVDRLMGLSENAARKEAAELGISVPDDMRANQRLTEILGAWAARQAGHDAIIMDHPTSHGEPPEMVVLDGSILSATQGAPREAPGIRAATEPASPSSATPFLPVPKEPERLTNFVRRMGGVNDVGGDVRQILGSARQRPGILNAAGRGLDDMTLLAWEHGYFPEFGEERPGINDFLERLDEDQNRGRPVYSQANDAAVAAYEQAIAHNSEIDRLASEHGIDTTGLTIDQFHDELARRLTPVQHEAIEADHDAAFDHFMRAAIAEDPSYGEAPTRSLEDLENEYRQEAVADAAIGGSEGGARSEPLGPDSGAGETGVGQNGRGAGVGGGDAAPAGTAGQQPAVDLLGRQIVDQPAPRVAAPTIRTDPSQAAMPGMEPSAVQAQAARDAQGRGALQSETPQRPANKGLFAPDTTGQGELEPNRAEPPVQPGMVRLYRGETDLPRGSTGTGPIPDWIKEAPEYQATVNATGRWFSRTRADAEYYNRVFGDGTGRISFVDLPEEDAAQYLSANNPEARQLSAAGRAREEYFVPRAIADGRTILYSFPGMLFDPDVYRRIGGPLTRSVLALREPLRTLTDSISNGLVPMRTGTMRSQAFAATFANSLRQVMYRYGRIDGEIERNFSPREREAMGRALDAQSVFEQSMREAAPSPEHEAAARASFDAEGTGLAGLTEPQRRAVEMLDRLSQDVWRQMQERGMVDPRARPLPYYMPRQIIRWSEGEGFSRVSGSGGGGGGLDQRGMNLTTKGPMRREHLTPEETEAAAKAKLGPDVQLLRDIRSLPQRLAFAQRAIAGVDLMAQIERVGQETGANLVLRGDIPDLLHPGDFFTIADHPSFRQFTGSGWRAVHVAREFEGPLRAVLTQRSPTWYRAAQGLKGGVMNAIMWSPFIHLAVELGRAFPVMPLRVLTLSAVRDGSRLRRDLGYMDQATRDGLAPLGQGWQADPVSIADTAMGASRNRFVLALASVRDAVANGAGRIGGQFLHDAIQHPHQTLLWDQVFNLQVGIYNTMRDRWIRRGFSPEVAGTMAASIANRYAGALPPEHLSRGANMAANLLLFSRSFTLGNLGVMKDMFTGAPPQVLSRIEQMAGPEVRASAKSVLQRKAISAVTMDIGLFWLANGLLQAGLQVLRQSQVSGLPQAAQDTYNQWLDEVAQSFQNARENPLELFGVLPQHWNEPGKQDRVYAGTDASGRGVYLRLPPGKVGEEFIGWMAKPGVMLEAKSSPLVRPIIEDITGYDSLGRAIYPPNPRTIGDAVRIAGIAVRHIVEGLGPVSLIQGAHEMWQQHVQGKPTATDPYISAMKILGPATGLAQVSQGFPGGPAAGEMHAQSAREKFDLEKALPDIRDKIRSGDLKGAYADMQALNVPAGLQRYYVNQTLHPGPTAGALRKMRGAPPAVQDRVQRQMSP